MDIKDDDDDFLGEIRSIEKAIETGEIITLEQVQQRISKFLDGLDPEIGFFQEVVDKLFIDGVVEISIELPDAAPIYILVAAESLDEIDDTLMDVEGDFLYDSGYSIDFANLDIEYYLYEQFNIYRCDLGQYLWDDCQINIDRYPAYFGHVENCSECQVSTKGDPPVEEPSPFGKQPDHMAGCKGAECSFGCMCWCHGPPEESEKEGKIKNPVTGTVYEIREAGSKGTVQELKGKWNRSIAAEEPEKEEEKPYTACPSCNTITEPDIKKICPNCGAEMEGK